MNVIFTLLLVLGSQLYAEGLLEVVWPKLDKQYEKQQKSYPSALKKAVKEITLPVYLPRRYLLDKTLFLVSDKNFYTATITLDGAILTISGDRTYQQKVLNGDKQLKRIVEDKAVEFINAEGIMMTDFNRHNVNYSLTVECDAPKEDSRCTQEEFLKNIYRELTLVGGKR